MRNFSNYIIKRRYYIIAFFLILTAISMWGMTKLNINTDVLSYIPQGTATTDGQKVLYENFNFNSSIAVAVDGTTIGYNDLSNRISEMKEIENVVNVSWLGDMQLIGIISPSHYNEIKQVFNKNGNYLIVVLLNVPSGGKDAGLAINSIRSILNGTTYEVGGTAALNQEIMKTSLGELPIYLTVAVLLVLVILLLTSRSYAEPIIFITTLGISIIINTGTNLLFKDISIITFCASGVLQIGLSMDYAIFLSHSYYEHKNKGLSPSDALRKAIPETFSTILASALTTIGGFLALFLMQFTVGMDLGRVLAKGIIMAFITVIVLQPCLILIFSKMIDKTSKKMIDFKFKGLAKASIKYRKVIIALFFLAIVPAFIGQYNVKYSYLEFMANNGEKTQLQEYVGALSKQTYIIAPVTSDNYAEQYEFLNNVKGIEGVNYVSSIFTFIPQELINTPMVKSMVTDKAQNMLNEDYALYSISINTANIESDETQLVLTEIKQAAEMSFGNSYYVTGATQGIRDFMDITPKDFRIITLVSILIILLILILNYGSIKYPLILIALIQLGIWINLSINSFTGVKLNFISYLVISAIQLGATIDYAILLTSKYKKNRNNMIRPLEAAKSASIDASMSILTSASIMVAACLSIGLIASFAVVKEIALLIARGSIISCVLVLCVLPSLLAFSDRLVKEVRVEEREHRRLSKLTKEYNNQ